MVSYMAFRARPEDGLRTIHRVERTFQRGLQLHDGACVEGEGRRRDCGNENDAANKSADSRPEDRGVAGG